MNATIVYGHFTSVLTHGSYTAAATTSQWKNSVFGIIVVWMIIENIAISYFRVFKFKIGTICKSAFVVQINRSSMVYGPEPFK